MFVVSIVATLVLGLAAGFVVNLAAARLPKGALLHRGLRCTQHGEPLSWWQALPVLGYLLQRGTCARCGRRLPVAFPLVELVTGLLFIALFIVDGWSLGFGFHAAYISVLLLVLVVDWRYRDIYVSTIVAGGVLGLAGSFVLPGVGPLGAMMGALVAGAFFFVAYLVARIIFHHIEEPLGMGDVLLALMMGLMLGFPNIVGALLVGALIGGALAGVVLLSRRGGLTDFMPYGVALCVATILLLLQPALFVEALHLSVIGPAVSRLFGG